ncbi:MAG: HEAT repeat domain-containing protein, partial [Candidatus Hermodarchaeia archaeon]
MRPKFEIVIETLLETSSLPSQDELAELSDLDQNEATYLNNVWDQLTLKLRRSLLEELGKQADENITFSFEQINRIGLNDADDEVRKLSILNLWESEDPNLILPIIDILKDDPSDDVKTAAASALGAFVLIGETQGLPDDRLELVENSLLDVHQSTANTQIKQNSLESLGYSSREEVNDLILNAFESGDESQVRSAILAMGRSANKKWKEFVITHLQSPSPLLRLESVIAVGELEIKEALPEIIDLVEDVDDKIRHSSIWCLS